MSDFLRSTIVFRELDAAALRELEAVLRVVALRDGDVLVRQGAANRNLYLVTSGCLRVSSRTPDSESRVLFDVQPGETVCEMGLLADDPSSTTVEAAGETSVLALVRDDFDRFCDAHPDVALHLMQSLGRRLQIHQLSLALHLGYSFAILGPELIRDLESELETLMLYGGEALFRQGEPADSLFLIVSGRVRVLRNEQDESRDVAELGPGEIVGEMAMVSGEVRPTTVVAVRDSQVARLTKTGFDRLVMKYPKWGVQLIGRNLARRSNGAHSGRRSGSHSISTVAIVPIHYSTPVGTFCQQLAESLSPFGPTLHLTSARLDQHLGRPGIAQTYERDGRNAHVVGWLAKQESEYRHVLYEADPFLSPWTERCIRQADQIILVGQGTDDPALGEIETQLLDSDNNGYLARQWLILVHDRDEPSGTRRWLDLRKVDRHFHVRLGKKETFDRIARLLTGRAVGLTLGGGFARGLAHVGVFHAFEELGLPIDVIGSASMGAMVGGLWAMGWDRDRMTREVCAACANHFGDWTFPFVALKRGGKFSQKVRNLFGDVQIDDLWVPFFCTSANLNRSELKIHTRGSLAKAVLAATRAPGVFPPVVYDGELHVDGGVINNVPVDLMKDFCNQGLTIGVDVAPPHPLKPVRDYGDGVSGWKTFWKRCVSKERLYTPSIFLVMIRTLEYTGIANLTERIKYADIFMSPEMLKFRRTDFHLAAEIVQAGYDCARENLIRHRDKFPTTGDEVSTEPVLAVLQQEDQFAIEALRHR
jgi:predicted acylesterase/phospholipase RssA/CRP-like cAMP-binding protein